MTDITPERIAELRRLAEAATPGPWELIPRAAANRDDPEPFVVFEWHESQYGRYPENDSTLLGDEDAAYIAAANPATMLALLDALEAERGLHALDHSLADRRERERDQLRAENERLRKAQAKLVRRRDHSVYMNDNHFWVRVRRDDFDELDAALAASPEQEGQ